jgi:hypothetical protein
MKLCSMALLVQALKPVHRPSTFSFLTCEKPYFSSLMQKLAAQFAGIFRSAAAGDIVPLRSKIGLLYA